MVLDPNSKLHLVNGCGFGFLTCFGPPLIRVGQTAITRTVQRYMLRSLSRGTCSAPCPEVHAPLPVRWYMLRSLSGGKCSAPCPVVHAPLPVSFRLVCSLTTHGRHRVLNYTEVSSLNVPTSPNVHCVVGNTNYCISGKGSVADPAFSLGDINIIFCPIF